jgi:hypothetical protein
MAIDAARVEALYRQFGPAILRRCSKFLRDRAEAEDAMQEVFVNVCRSLDGFRYGCNPLSWIYQHVGLQWPGSQRRGEQPHRLLGGFGADGGFHGAEPSSSSNH